MNSPKSDDSTNPIPRPVTEVDVRVRYVECDPMGLAHHSTYPIWLEMARTEHLRRHGLVYRDLEAAGVLFVVARMSLRYRKPARYDDVLRVAVSMRECAGVKVEHDYRVTREGELLCEAQTTLVCVDREGKLRPVPEGLR